MCIHGGAPEEASSHRKAYRGTSIGGYTLAFSCGGRLRLLKSLAINYLGAFLSWHRSSP